ncbi:ABC transporter ATP-binding protein/permease [Kocuria sp. p3-SID1433]|uniref:ABC transporter ATP-binding protein n=1 Tax=unclassified Kocuria TaxID=2649579 RepID=UPI0021A49450|nr:MULTISPECIES: ABC transporter ATP-binding protein [unclassified Kocuria]MCT1601474.1 ABC transporter ATP-binding protein/permease [Kocuria sp. p3-SID1428]MCT2179367.1 ABC transporter ATP-binding protein/permease [Kocuria sp. p3-SID1433]
MSPSTSSSGARRAEAEAATGTEALKDEPLISPEIDPDDAAPAGDGWGAGAPARKPRSFWPSVRRLGGLMVDFKAGLSVVLVFITGSVALSVLAPMLLGRATDVVFAGVLSRDLPPDATQQEVLDGLRAEGRDSLADVFSTMALDPGSGVDFGRLGTLILLVLVMYLVASILQWAQGRILNAISVRIIRDLRAQVEDKLHRIPLSYFDTRRRGDVMSRVTNDVDNVQTALQQTFSSLLENIMRVLGILIMMFVLSWQLALVALIALPLSAAAAGIVGSRAQKHFGKQWAATGALNGQIEEDFTGHQLVTVFGREEDMARDFDRRNDDLYRSAFAAQFVSGTIMPIMQFVSWLSYVGIVVVGGMRVVSGSMTLGAATAFIQYSREFNQPLSQVASMATQIQSGVASAERVFELLDAPEQDPESAPALMPERTEGRVRFEHVDFSYQPDEPLIEDLSFTAEPGRTVAIVGPTGAGKTTLVNLVMRFYEIDSGRITLDGTDVREMTRAQLRSQVGMVLQDAWLFTGTIRENIRYGRLEATDEEVEEAARATSVDRLVRSLPEGYETVLDDDGGSISAGERQLITIARAFLAAPALLILDEATSSVDTRTEVAVQKAMAALRRGRTSFVIAHRLSTIRDADTILVMSGGRIIEQGSHDELMGREGAYRALYESQFSDEPPEEPETLTGSLEKQ